MTYMPSAIKRGTATRPRYVPTILGPGGEEVLLSSGYIKRRSALLAAMRELQARHWPCGDVIFQGRPLRLPRKRPSMASKRKADLNALADEAIRQRAYKDALAAADRFDNRC